MFNINKDYHRSSNCGSINDLALSVQNFRIFQIFFAISFHVFFFIITARKRSFTRVCLSTWGHAWRGEACVAGGRVWQGGCVAGGMHGRGCAFPPLPRQILRDTVNERTVRILLECILV